MNTAKKVQRIDPTADVYTRREKVYKISIPVSPGHAASLGSKAAVRRMMRARFPGWTKQQHIDAAYELAEMELQNTREWWKIANEAALATWGRPWRFGDYRVAGIGSYELSTEYRDRLRANAQLGAAIYDARRAHEVAATGRFTKRA